MSSRAAGVLLAAGASRRFGANKLHHEVEPGIPLGVYAAHQLITVLPGSVAVVRNDDAILPTLFRQMGLRVVINPYADDGMGSSLAIGVAATAGADGWIIALADMPNIQRSTYQRVADSLISTGNIVAPCYAGKRGHPVGFPRRFGNLLQTLRGDKGAREIISMNPIDVSLFDVTDTGVVQDVDELADLDKHALPP